MAADIPSRCLLLLSISGLATAGFFSVPRFGGSWLGRFTRPKFEFMPETFELKPLNLDDIKIDLGKFKMPEINIPAMKFNPIRKEEGTNIFNPLQKDEGTNRFNPLPMDEGTNKFNPIPPNDKELYSILDELDETKNEDKLLKPKDDENVLPSKTNEDEMKKKKTEKRTEKNDDGDDDDGHHHHHHHHHHSNHEHPDATQGGDFRERICDDNDTSASTPGTTNHATNGASENTGVVVTATYEPRSDENGSGNSSANKHFINIASRRAKIWTIVLISLGATLILAVGGYFYKSRKKTRHMDDEFGLLQ